MSDELTSAPLAQTQPLQSQVTTLDKLFFAVYGQESSYGANPKTSGTGARGPMQIEPDTFAEFAQPGEDIDNPNDNIRVGHRILAHYLQMYHGDAARAAVAYFSGPGNVAPMNSPVPWRENRSDGATSVASYVGSIGQRMGDSNIAQFAKLHVGAEPSENTFEQPQPLSPIEALVGAGEDAQKQAPSSPGSGPAPAAAARSAALRPPPARAVQLPVQPTQPLRVAHPLDYYHALLTKQPILGGGSA